jgi:hypothetical protein
MQSTGAAALALSLVTVPAAQARRTVSALRGGLPDEVHLWLGGSAAREIQQDPGVEVIESLDDLESRIALLGCENSSARSRGG